MDDDAVMGEGKGSPLGIAAIALVGDDATAPSRSVAVVTPPSDERWAEPLWSAPKMPQIQVIVEADALLPKELLVRVLALLDAKEVSAVATANASFKALCDEPHVLLERAAAAVPRDEKAARVLYERVADEPRACLEAQALLGRLADDAETAEGSYRAALATTASPLLAFFPSEDDARAFATIGLATLLRASFRPREAARSVKGLSQIGGRAVEAVWQHAQACALMSMDWTRGPASPAHENWIEEGLALLAAIAAPEMHAFYWTGVLHKIHATRSPERAQAACTALLRAFEAGCPLAAYDLGELYAAVGGPDRVQDAHTYVFAAALRGDERAVRRASELTYLIHHGPAATRAQIGQALADAQALVAMIE